MEGTVSGAGVWPWEGYILFHGVSFSLWKMGVCIGTWRRMQGVSAGKSVAQPPPCRVCSVVVLVATVILESTPITEVGPLSSEPQFPHLAILPLRQTQPGHALDGQEAASAGVYLKQQSRRGRWAWHRLASLSWPSLAAPGFPGGGWRRAQTWLWGD